MYSRYVPPPKARVDSNVNDHQKHNPKETQPDSYQPQQPIQSDASATYARYIPPSKAITPSQQERIAEPTKILTSHPKRKSDELHDHLAPKAKKSKKVKEKKHESEDVSNNNRETASIEAQDAEEAEAEELAAKSVKRRKNKERQDPDVEMEEPTAVDDPRHAKLLAKREKSFKKAARTARKQALYDADGAVEGIEATTEEPPELHDLEPLPQPEPVPAPVGGTFSALPPWLESPIRVTPDARASFTDLGLHKSTMDVLKSKGFEDAFAVQTAVLPLFLGPEKQLGDVLISAATGSGKTLAYVLPVIQDISNTTVPRLRGLIVMPTRELVSQAREVCEICANAFSSTSRRRINIGVAVGNQTLSAEQTTLMAEELEYDPVEYQRREDAANARWETASQESDNSEEFILDQDESFAGLPNHVSKPTLKVDILICTPGRLVEHLKSTSGFTLEHIKWLVVDEADKLLDQSFQQWLEIVMSQLPKKNDGDVRKIVLSATMTRDLGLLAGLKLYRPKLVVLESNNEVGGTEDQAERHGEALSLPETLVESAVKVENDGDKPLYLLHLLKHYLEAHGVGRVDALPESDVSSSSESDTSDEETESSSSESGMETSAKTNGSWTKPMKSSNAPKGILIFTKSNESALRLARLLALLESSLATKISTLTSTIRASTRRKTLRSFHNGTTSILLASDLVSRGLDLPDLAHVVNYDLPTSLTSYIHRVGRTARAGRTGYAWTLFSKTEARWFWNEISRSERVIRPRGGKVARINIGDGIFGDKLRKEYENALEALGKEASGA